MCSNKCQIPKVGMALARPKNKKAEVAVLGGQMGRSWSYGEGRSFRTMWSMASSPYQISGDSVPLDGKKKVGNTCITIIPRLASFYYGI